MTDQFTETVTKGWGSRIMGSFKGILVGLLLFLVSFVVLYVNEGRVDKSQLAEDAQEIQAGTEASSDMNGEFVYATGVLSTKEKIGDTYLQSGDYVLLKRKVEMYSWEEEKETDSDRNLGGSETQTTTYTYEKTWSEDPDSSTNFKYPEDHQNPLMSIKSDEIRVGDAQVGIYSFNVKDISLPAPKIISLNPDKVILKNGVELADDQYLFKGQGSLSNPQIGDLRISYYVVPNNLEPATIFGKLDTGNNNISPYYGKKDTKIYRIFEGTRDTAISQMKKEHSMITWILRILGFLLMWGGLMMLFKPISVLLDVLPILGSISRFGVGLATFLIALVLSLITILISMIVHSLWALLAVIVLFAIGVVWYLKSKSKK